MADEDIAYEQATAVAGIATPKIWGKLLEVQAALKVEKAQHNSFGGFDYRSKEDILEAAKPLCRMHGLVLLCDDEVIEVGGWKYVHSTATVLDALTGDTVQANGLAREPEVKKGMDASQITGTASSYAGKRALGNLFALDDTKDSDAPTGQERQPPESGPFSARCRACGHVHQFYNRTSYEQWVAYWQQGGDKGRCCPSISLEVV